MKKFIAMFVLILVIIGLTIGLAYSCKTVINKNNEITALEQKNKDYEEGIKELNSKIEKMQDTEDNKTEENNSSKEDISILFDENKISNKKENIKVSQDISDTMSVLSVNVNTETNSLIINLDKELSNLIYGYNENTESHTITGFSQKIVDAQISIVVKDIKDLKVVILMEDGTVKYIGIDNILDKSYTVKSVTDSKGYVKLTKVILKDETQSEIKYGIVGIKADGTIDIIEF